MFIESLFNFPGSTVLKKEAFHYQVWIPRTVYKLPEVQTQLQKIFFEKYDRITLMHRAVRKNKILLIVLWRRGYANLETPPLDGEKENQNGEETPAGS